MTGRRITLVRAATGELTPAFSQEPILSSAKIPWDGILLEQHQLSAHESPEFYIPQHLICILLDVPAQLEWRVAGERRQSQLIKPGDVGFIPANLPRQIHWKHSREALYLTLDPIFIARVADELEFGNSVQLIDRWGRCDPQIYHIVLALKAELEAGGLAGRLYGESLTQALAIHLLRRYTTTDRIRQDVTGGLSFQRLRTVSQYINDNLEQDLSLGAIAATIGMGSYHFARLFKQSTGLPPYQYVTERRLERARILLTQTDLTIAEVGLRVGFTSQSHFTLVFRKRVGTTPLAYRQGV